jgi:comEA protein
MFTFNRKEQLAILLLSAALLLGLGVNIVAELRNGGLPEFRVVKNAVQVPQDSTVRYGTDTPSDTVWVSVNVNTASVEELQRLPRVGPATARRIVDYRARNGRFASAEELAHVSGIGPRTVERLRPLISLGSR